MKAGKWYIFNFNLDTLFYVHEVSIGNSSQELSCTLKTSAESINSAVHQFYHSDF